MAKHGHSGGGSPRNSVKAGGKKSGSRGKKAMPKKHAKGGMGGKK